MAGFGPWITLELDDEEQADMAVPDIADKPQYPWGARFCFTGRELEKGDLPMPNVGDLIDMRVMAKVTNVSASESGDCRVEMVMTMVRLENEDDDDEDDV